ncbi:uncharacterized protein F4822DRAFT_312292 [Hypoxylon trugodes]|uniref:uncharacterized protein n=1 Tax=Hypoxylon trugodes TaxID=326681 RepID=UPI00219D711E|nr:uncharacterized protein F4822DRAFT_312292 [Hypoxylon trugodes]KAI1386318.1 hypothetical protein F4822DRAFT_312292 [Hypoxylon trugodes]
MSTNPQVQNQTNVKVLNARTPIAERPSPLSMPRPIIPSKRSDDDIQFISSKPVKRQRTGEQRQMPALQEHEVPAIPIIAPPIAVPPFELRGSDRRVSTGMVGLPSDFSVMELTSALRGVSLPVLEKFALDQPPRKPRPLSPPELSPKQLPQAIMPAIPNINTGENSSKDPGLRAAPMACMIATSESSAKPDASSRISNLNSAPGQFHVLNTSTINVDSLPPNSARSPKEAMPPPPLPRAEVSAVSNATSTKHATENVAQLDAIEQPCQICARMRQQVNLAKPQVHPLLQHNLPPHVVSQMVPYGQHLHPHMMAMNLNGMHAFNPGFGPMMMPIHGSNFTAPPSHISSPTSPTQMSQLSEGEVSQLEPPNSGSQPQASPTSAAGPVEPPTALNPVKPPASLIQPTYRKPSPNLIVDVAETCQEKFPFAEVAKRHDVPVEKVFDIFAAIIQVPLLRCPTDRRRAGKLATARVKEYAKAKKFIQEIGVHDNSDPKEDIVASPSDIANHLGQVDLPEGFNLRDP